MRSKPLCSHLPPFHPGLHVFLLQNPKISDPLSQWKIFSKVILNPGTCLTTLEMFYRFKENYSKIFSLKMYLNKYCFSKQIHSFGYHLQRKVCHIHCQSSPRTFQNCSRMHNNHLSVWKRNFHSVIRCPKYVLSFHVVIHSTVVFLW